MDHPIGIILTSVDDASMAKTLARDLIDARLAACVQVSPAGTSVYRWAGEVQEGSEYCLSIKTAQDRCPEVVAWLEQHHPYDTPEILVLTAQAARAYAEWVRQESGTPHP